jgi:hypothetical protein
VGGSPLLAVLSSRRECGGKATARHPGIEASPWESAWPVKTGGAAEQSEGSVVNVDQERAIRPAVLEPGVLAAVYLDQLAQTFAPVPGLMRFGDLLVTRQPDVRCHHPLSERLLGHLDAVDLAQLLPITPPPGGGVRTGYRR